MTLEVVPIHKHPEYLVDCCNILNQEWKRSETARLHSLEQSCDRLPTSLILLENKTVIGHLKLSKIASIQTACFVESVVIEMNLRGKGYGSILMREAESFCKKLGLDTIYLSTKGQEEFYRKLGYNNCAPISIYGNFVSKNPANTIRKPVKLYNDSVLIHNNVNCIKYVPPPPPPPILMTNKVSATEKTFMKKIL